MTGQVIGRQPHISVVFAIPNQPGIGIEFVIDTGFEGTLTLPEAAILAMRLPFEQRIQANLADDSSVPVDVYKATIIWQDREIEVSVLAMGHRPLLGTALLDGNDLHVRFRDGGPLNIETID
jgi:clan AA aspartic protease